MQALRYTVLAVAVLAALLLTESVHAQTAELETRINSAPNGASIELSGTWTLDEPLDVDAHGQTVFANGARFVNPRASCLGCPHEPAIRLHGSGLRWVGGTVDGPNDAGETAVTISPFWQNGREWDPAFQILDASHIMLEGVRIEQPWGDGVTVWGNSHHVTIRGAHITGAGRNGVSFVRGTDLTVENTTIPYTPGLWAIDIEPDNSIDRLDNIVVRNNTIGWSPWPGINLTGPWNENTVPPNPFGRIVVVDNRIGQNGYGLHCLSLAPRDPTYIETLEEHGNICTTVAVEPASLPAAPTASAAPPAPAAAPAPMAIAPPAVVQPRSCRVPRVRGLTRQRAVRKLRRAGCRYRVRGRGRVVRTRPRAGTRTANIVRVRLAPNSS